VVSNDPTTNEIYFALDFSYYNYYNICQPIEDNFTLDYFWSDTGEQVNIDLGTIAIFSPPLVYEVSNQAFTECGDLPKINALICRNLIISEIVEPLNECGKPTANILMNILCFLESKTIFLLKTLYSFLLHFLAGSSKTNYSQQCENFLL